VPTDGPSPPQPLQFRQQLRPLSLRYLPASHPGCAKRCQTAELRFCILQG
jgi:hypothetical protein